VCIETLNLQLSIQVLSIVEYDLKYVANFRYCFELERKFSIEGHNVGQSSIKARILPKSFSFYNKSRY